MKRKLLLSAALLAALGAGITHSILSTKFDRRELKPGQHAEFVIKPEKLIGNSRHDVYLRLGSDKDEPFAYTVNGYESAKVLAAKRLDNGMEWCLVNLCDSKKRGWVEGIYVNDKKDVVEGTYYDKTVRLDTDLPATFERIYAANDFPALHEALVRLGTFNDPAVREFLLEMLESTDSPEIISDVLLGLSNQNMGKMSPDIKAYFNSDLFNSYYAEGLSRMAVNTHDRTLIPVLEREYVETLEKFDRRKPGAGYVEVAQAIRELQDPIESFLFFRKLAQAQEETVQNEAIYQLGQLFHDAQSKDVRQRIAYFLEQFMWDEENDCALRKYAGGHFRQMDPARYGEYMKPKAYTSPEMRRQYEGRRFIEDDPCLSQSHF